MPVWLPVESACLASSAACFYQPIYRSGSWHFCHYFLGLICVLTQSIICLPGCFLHLSLLPEIVALLIHLSALIVPFLFHDRTPWWPFLHGSSPLASPQVPQYLSLLLGFGQCCSSHHRCWFSWGVIGWVQFR